MENITQILLRYLEEVRAYYKGSTNPLEVQLIADHTRGHFQLLMLGWKEGEYHFQCLLHLSLKEGKVWVEWNDTAEAVEEELIRAGIPPSDIVLSLLRPVEQ